MFYKKNLVILIFVNNYQVPEESNVVPNRFPDVKISEI